MEKIFDTIEKLALKARTETPPQFSVANRVMAQIELQQRTRFSILPFQIFAGVSAVAASIVIFFSIQALQSLANPLAQLFTASQGASIW